MNEVWKFLPSKKVIHIPPAILFILLAICIITVSSLVFIHVISQPWLGIIFEPADKSKTGLLIYQTIPNTPAAEKLKKGQRILSIESTKNDNNKVVLTPSLLDFPLNFPRISEYNNYLDKHQKISKILHEGQVKLIIENSTAIIIEPKQYRTLSSVPFIYWLLICTNFIGLILGAIVWLCNSKKGEGKLLFLMGFGYYMMVIPSILMLKELAIVSSYLLLIPVIENFFSSLFGIGLMALLMTYPNRLYPNYYLWIITSTILLFWLNATVQWINLPFHTFHLQYIFMYPIVLFFSYKQWITTKNDPVKRAACSAFLLPVFIFAVTTVSLFMFPLIFFGKPLLNPEFAKFLLGATFIGFAVSILQYRLFDVEKWWFKTWLWLLSGLLIIVLDILLVYILNIRYFSALGISVISVGFIYFPLRQWLFQRLLPQSALQLQDYIPSFSKTVTEHVSPTGFENSWKRVIQERYSPINIEYSRECSTLQLYNNGLMIRVPDTQNKGHYQLTGKSNGLRLFNTKDCEDINSLHTLMSLIDQTSQKHHDLITNERNEIMRDMHDTVGSSLLTLTCIMKNQPEVKHVRNTLQTLRDTIHLTTSEEPLYLVETLADCRIEAKERCEIAGIVLQWPQVTLPEKQVLTVSMSITLINIIREAISNALHHATPSEISISIKSTETHQLIVSIANNGTVQDYKKWKPNNGLNNMRARALKSGGLLTISTGKHHAEVLLKLLSAENMGM